MDTSSDEADQSSRRRGNAEVIGVALHERGVPYYREDNETFKQLARICESSSCVSLIDESETVQRKGRDVVGKDRIDASEDRTVAAG